MKKTLFLVLAIITLGAASLAAQGWNYRVDSVGSVKHVELFESTTAYVTHNGFRGVAWQSGSSTNIKFLGGSAGTVFLYQELTMPNDTSMRTGVYDTIRVPVVYYDYDSELTVHNGIYLYDGTAGRILGIVDPTYYGRLRIYTTEELSPTIKLVVTW